MAIVTSQELAKLIGTEYAHVRVWKNRGQLVARDDKLFDTEHPVNKLWIAKKRADHGKSTSFDFVEENKPSVTRTDWNDAEDVRERKRVVIESKSASNDAISQLIKQKEQYQLEKIQEEIKLLKARNEKISGETIPTELVSAVFSQFGKSTVVSFLNAAEDLLVNVSAMKQLSREEYAKLKGELKRIVNNAAAEAIKTAKAQVENIVGEYSQRKGRGEKS